MQGFTFKKNKRNYSPATFPFMRKTIIPVTRHIFNPVITNRHNMPLTGPCFIYGNHSNYFDPFFLNLDMTEEPTAGVMTRDQFHKTIPRIFMDSIGIVPTSKYVPEPGIVRDVLKMIDMRRMIVIFPEGGRRWDGRKKPLIETTLKLFWKMKIPVHPVQIHGSHLSWPRWADKYRKSTIELRWLDPVRASDFPDYETFADTCRSNIDFDEYYPPDTVEIHSCSKPAKGIHRLLYRCPESGVSGSVFSPDGKSVFSRTAPFSYKMNLRSRLVDRHGQEYSIIEMFDRINSMPIKKDRDDLILSSLGARIFIIDKKHRLNEMGSGLAELTTENLYLSYGSQKDRIPLEEVRYLSVEQNHKITVTTNDTVYQVAMNTENALEWQSYIRRLQGGEKAVLSF